MQITPNQVYTTRSIGKNERQYGTANRLRIPVSNPIGHHAKVFLYPT
jgi:hypothetical protein